MITPQGPSVQLSREGFLTTDYLLLHFFLGDTGSSLSPRLASFTASHSFSIYPCVHKHPVLSHPMGTYQFNDFSSSYCQLWHAGTRGQSPQKPAVSILDALSEIIRTFISIREHGSVLCLLR